MIWLNLPYKEKKNFTRHLRHIWEIARHRIPKICDDALTEMQRSGQLEIIAGRLINIQDSREKITVEFNDKKTRKLLKMDADVLLNCTGPVLNYNKINEPLVQNLMKQEILCTDEMQLGMNALPNGALIDKSGKISDKFFTIGTPLKGILWECTAVPEIRHQAHDLAKLLLK